MRAPRTPPEAMEPRRTAAIQCKVWATTEEIDGLGEKLRREHPPMWVEEEMIDEIYLEKADRESDLGRWGLRVRNGIWK